MYTQKEVLWYFKHADIVERDYWNLATDDDIRISWYEIKDCIERMNEREQELFRLFKEGFLAKEIAIDWKMVEDEINREKYKMVRKIVKELNNKKKRVHSKK